MLMMIIECLDLLLERYFHISHACSCRELSINWKINAKKSQFILLFHCLYSNAMTQEEIFFILFLYIYICYFYCAFTYFCERISWIGLSCVVAMVCESVSTFDVYCAVLPNTKKLSLPNKVFLMCHRRKDCWTIVSSAKEDFFSFFHLLYFYFFLLSVSLFIFLNLYLFFWKLADSGSSCDIHRYKIHNISSNLSGIMDNFFVIEFEF